MKTLILRVDNQGCCDDRYYKSERDLRDQLRNFHSIDVEGAEDMSLDLLLDIGDWTMERVKVSRNQVQELLNPSF